MTTVDLNHYVKILWKWLWLFVLSVVVAGGMAYLIQRRIPRTYTSSTTLLVGDILHSPNPQGDMGTIQILADSYAQMAQTQTILDAADRALGLPFDWEVLRGRVLVVHPVGAQNFTIGVIDTDPNRARAIAGAIAQQLIAASPTTQYEQKMADQQPFLLQQIDDLRTKMTQAKSDLQKKQAQIVQETSARAVLDQQDEIRALQLNLSTWQTTYASLLATYAAGNNSPNILSVVVPATIPTSPSGPNVQANVALAAMTGLILAIAGVLLIEYLDDTIKTKDDLERLAGVPTLGLMRRLQFPNKDRSRLIVVDAPESASAEAYRSIAVNLSIASVGRSSSVILVTSAGPQEGKSLTAANLATALAQGGKNVLLVDMDLRSPTQNALFKLPNQTGVTSLMLDPNLRPADCVVETVVPNLKLLPSGAVQPAADPSRLIPSDVLSRFGERLLKDLRGLADFVIIDSPPILAATDAVILAVLVDGTLLVARAGETRRGRCSDATEVLTRAHARLIGTILNAVPTDDRLYGYHRYRYRQNRPSASRFLGLGRRATTSPRS